MAAPPETPALAGIAAALAGLVLACAAPATRDAATPAGSPPRPPQATSSPGTAPGPAPTAIPVRKISVAMSSTGISYLQHRVALDAGFFREAGYDVEVQIAPSNALLAAVVAGEVPFGDSGGSAIRAAAADLPVRLVSCHGIRPLYSLILGPGLRAAQEVEGKGLAINAIGSDTHIIGRDLIRKFGGDPTKVEYLPLGTSSVRYAAVESGRVGGGIVTVTESLLAREAGMAVLSTIEDLPLACNAGVVVSLAAIAERRADVAAYYGAIRRAVDFMHDQPAETVRIFAEWEGIDLARAEAAYDAAQVRFSWSNERGAAEQAIENALAFAKEAAQIDPGTRLADVADFSFYP